MRLSERLLKAIESDRHINEQSRQEFYHSHRSIMQFYDCLLKLEDSPTMMNYDYWGIDRPEGLHSLGQSIDSNNT